MAIPAKLSAAPSKPQVTGDISAAADPGGLGASAGEGLVSLWLRQSGDRRAESVRQVWGAAGAAGAAYDIDDGAGTVLLSETATLDGAARLIEPALALAGRDADCRDYRLLASNGNGGRRELDQYPCLVMIRVFAPAQWERPFRDWLHGEHFRRQLSAPGVLACRGYEAVGGQKHFLNIWAVEEPGALATEHYIELRATAWYARVSPVFEVSRIVREVCRPLARTEEAAI